MKSTKKFFKDVVLYSGSNFFSNILNFIVAIAIRRILQPALMGLYNEIMLIFDYAQYSHLGMLNSLDKELPYLYGKKDDLRAAKVRDIGFTVCLAVVLSISAGIFISSFFIMDGGNRLLVNGIRIISFLVPLRLLSSLYVVLNRSRHNFSAISAYTVLVAILDVSLKIFLTVRFGLYGLLWASVLTVFLGVAYFYKASGERFAIISDFVLDDIIHLMKIGFPIFVMGFVFMTLTNMDRIMIIRLLGEESLGFYTIGLMLSVYVVQLPNLIYAVIFPRFYEAYGERQDILHVKDLFIKPTMVFACLFPVLVGCAIIFLPLLVRYVLPAYIPGLIPAYILILGSSFLSLVNMPGYLLVVLDKQAKAVLICAASILVAAVTMYVFVKKLGLGLAGIAAGASVSYLIYASAVLSYAFKNYTKRPADHAKFLSELYMPFFWVLAVLLLLKVFAPWTSGNIRTDLAFAVLKEAIFLVCCIPVIIYANRKTGILTLLKDMYIKKWEAG